MRPKALEEYLQKNKITKTRFAKMNGFCATTVSAHFKVFNITGYVIPRKILYLIHVSNVVIGSADIFHPPKEKKK